MVPGELEALLLDGLEGEVGLLGVQLDARVLALQLESSFLDFLKAVASGHLVLGKRRPQSLLQVFPVPACHRLPQLLLQ